MRRAGGGKGDAGFAGRLPKRAFKMRPRRLAVEQKRADGGKTFEKGRKIVGVGAGDAAVQTALAFTGLQRVP